MSDHVLTPPQHYHVEVLVYEKEDGPVTLHSTQFDFVSNDVALAVERAKDLGTSVQKFHHVRSVRQCSDASHLEGLVV